jgi:hypothetical protein
MLDLSQPWISSIHNIYEQLTDKTNISYNMSSLDPAYIDWLKETTNRLWPIIRDGHFALHTYHTNFNLGKKDIGKADEKEKEIDVLCDKYGPLYSNIAFAKVDEDAWVTSYRVS